MKQGMYLTTWNEQEIQLSYVINDEYFYVYVEDDIHNTVGQLDKGGWSHVISRVSVPISKKRAYLLGYGDFYDKLMD